MRNRYEIVNIQTNESEENGLLAGEIRKITGLTVQQVSVYARHGYIVKGTWKILIDDDEYTDIWSDEMCMHWDCIRKMVLGGMRLKASRERKLRF